MANWKWFYREDDDEVTTTYLASTPKLAGQSLGTALLKQYKGAQLYGKIRISNDIFIIVLTVDKKHIYIHARAAGQDAPWLPGDHDERLNKEFIAGIESSFSKQTVAFLTKVEAAVSVMHVEAAIRKFLDRFFKEYNLPMPRIKIVNQITSTWLGRTLYSRKVDLNNTTIEIQKRVTTDEKSLDRVIAHELIHHWEFLTKYGHPDVGEEIWKKMQAMRKYGIKPESHGKDFYDWAEKINSVMGKDYVTKESDMSYVTEIDKDFYVIILPATSGKFSYAWMVRPSKDQQIQAQKMMIEQKAKLFLTRDSRFTNGFKVKKYGPTGVPRDEDLQKTLKQMYETGKPVVPTWNKLITKISDFKEHHDKMVNHYGKDMENILKNDPLGVLK